MGLQAGTWRSRVTGVGAGKARGRPAHTRPRQRQQGDRKCCLRLRRHTEGGPLASILVPRTESLGSFSGHQVPLGRKQNREVISSPLKTPGHVGWTCQRAVSPSSWGRSTGRGREHDPCRAGLSGGTPRRCRQPVLMRGERHSDSRIRDDRVGSLTNVAIDLRWAAGKRSQFTRQTFAGTSVP